MLQLDFDGNIAPKLAVMRRALRSDRRHHHDEGHVRAERSKERSKGRSNEHELKERSKEHESKERSKERSKGRSKEHELAESDLAALLTANPSLLCYGRHKYSRVLFLAEGWDAAGLRVRVGRSAIRTVLKEHRTLDDFFRYVVRASSASSRAAALLAEAAEEDASASSSSSEVRRAAGGAAGGGPDDVALA